MASLLRWCTCAALLLAGCFKDTYEPPPAAATTDGGSCPEGDLGCPCFPNATCSEGLSCATSVDTCIPEGCTPGELACSCNDDGSCAAPATCVGGICQNPDPPETDTTPPDDTTDSTSGPSTTTVDPTATTDPDPSTSTDTTSGDTLATDCDQQPDCQMCLECADEEITACATERATCQTVPGCITVATCLRNCGLTGVCLDACCDGMTQLAIDNAFALTVCGTDTCVSTCNGLEFPSTCPT